MAASEAKCLQPFEAAVNPLSLCCAGPGEDEGAGGREGKERRTNLPVRHAWSQTGLPGSLHCQGNGLCALLLPWCWHISHPVSPEHMGIWAVHLSPLSCSCRKIAQGNTFLTSKAAILGDLLHHAGGKWHVSIISPSYGSIWLLSPPQLTLTSIPGTQR